MESPSKKFSLLQLEIISKNSFLVKRDPPRRIEVAGNPRASRHSIPEREDTGIFFFEFFHRFRKSIAQPFDHLEQRKVDVGKLTSEKKLASFRVALQDSFKVIEELGHALGGKVRGAPFGFALLIFVVKAAGDRMMSIVSFGDPVGNRQLQLVRPQPAGFIFRREAEARAKKK